LPEKYNWRGLVQACHARISEVPETPEVIDVDYPVEVREPVTFLLVEPL